MKERGPINPNLSAEEIAELEDLQEWLKDVWDDPEDLTAQRERYQSDSYGDMMEEIERRRGL